MDVRIFGALTEFGSHGPVGIYQRPNTAKTVRPRYLPARPPQGACAHTRLQVCVRYKIPTPGPYAFAYMYICTRTQSHEDSSLHRNAVIYSTEMKKEPAFAKFDVGIRAVCHCNP